MPCQRGFVEEMRCGLCEASHKAGLCAVRCQRCIVDWMRCALCEDSQKPFLDFMDGGAWLPVGGGVVRLVTFVNDWDLSLLCSLC